MTKIKQTGMGQGVALKASQAFAQKNKATFLGKAKALGLRLWRDESGQGTAEYVLILVGVLALAYAFKGKIVPIIKGKMTTIGQDISGFTRNSQ